MKIQFNTGRGYSAEGQRIIAVRETYREHDVARERVRFKDLDRHVCGAVPLARWLRQLTEGELRDLVMANYDHNNYEMAIGGDLVWEEPYHE